MTRTEVDEIKLLRDEFRALREEIAPAVRFYHQATGILALLRWLGPVSVLAAVFGVAVAAGLMRL